MTARPNPETFALDTFLLQQSRKSLLRFIACGSVDHGKSSLIGRLLYEAKFLLEDQITALQDESRKSNALDADLDFALLLDGLAAEREQKITIDVAYRFFMTERRKFIVADTPGHEQYTRNMATGASTADLALIVISAENGLTTQTRRHALIVSTLGVSHFVVAINKMDLVGWEESTFRAIEADFQALAKDIGIHAITCIPTSAKIGDNVVRGSKDMDWYRGPSLLEYLEQVKIAEVSKPQPFRMPIQWVNRPHSHFRGYSGLIASGDIHTGTPVRILPSGQTTHVSRIVTFNGDLNHARAGQSVTLTFADEIDASRGDLIAEIGHLPSVTERLSSRVFWMGKDELVPGRTFLIKLGTSSARATVEPNLRVFDLDKRVPIDSECIGANEIGHVTLRLDRPIAADHYAENKETGSFILIDPESYDTVGMGCVENAAAEKSRFAKEWERIVSRWAGASRGLLNGGKESHARSIVKAISWRGTGSLDTFIITYLITGSPGFAGSVAATEIITKIAFYYLHERAWSLIPWGRS